MQRVVNDRDADTVPAWIALTDREALDSRRVGMKASQLALALRAGLPVEPGIVLTCQAVRAWQDDTQAEIDLDRAVDMIWERLGQARERALIVRSSCTAEDTTNSSMAGQFATVLGVCGRDELERAVRCVADSKPRDLDADMAVLVQPMLFPIAGGVLFTADPVSGNTDRVVVAAVEGGPSPLVSGEATGAHYLLSRRGRLIAARDPIPLLGRREQQRLARLGRRAGRIAGRPQDIEWAILADGSLRLLQSRPITTLPSPDRRRARGPVYGPGPLGETFPEPLSRLERDLWLGPLERALAHVLSIVGSPRSRRHPTMVVIGGRAAIDLERLGVIRRFRTRVDPRVACRHLGAAWRIGRLRIALPRLVDSQVETIDEQLTAVPALGDLTDRELVTILDRSGDALVALHGYELLTSLLQPRSNEASAVGVALHALRAARRAGTSDDEIVVAAPITLALTVPRVGPSSPLPATSEVPADPSGADHDALGPREQLRLRVRWVHELTARAAHELGRRLALATTLVDADDVRMLSIDELRRAVHQPESLRATPLVLDRDFEDEELPVRFRLTDDGSVVAAGRRRRRRLRGDARLTPDNVTTGLSAGSGRASGVVWDGSGVRPTAAVLVVRTLEPRLAVLLPDCVAIVAETGSILSHLAILARECKLPTVVNVPQAIERFPIGSYITVDGTNGRVTLEPLTIAMASQP